LGRSECFYISLQRVHCRTKATRQQLCSSRSKNRNQSFLSHDRDLFAGTRSDRHAPDFAQRRRRPASIDDVIDTLDRWERRSPMSIQSGAPAVVDRHPLNRAAKLAAWDEVVFDETQLPTNIEESLTAIEDARASVYAKSVAASAEQRPASIEQRQAAAVSEGFTTRRPSIVSVEPGRRRISSDSFSLRLRRRRAGVCWQY